MVFTTFYYIAELKDSVDSLQSSDEEITTIITSIDNKVTLVNYTLSDALSVVNSELLSVEGAMEDINNRLSSLEANGKNSIFTTLTWRDAND